LSLRITKGRLCLRLLFVEQSGSAEVGNLHRRQRFQCICPHLRLVHVRGVGGVGAGVGIRGSLLIRGVIGSKPDPFGARILIGLRSRDEPRAHRLDLGRERLRAR
jgi:hypothetical protein